MSEEIFMLYQKEVNALVKRGYKDAIKWIELAVEKFPDASAKDILTVANAIIKDKDVFQSNQTTDASKLSIQKARAISKAGIDKAHQTNKELELAREEERKVVAVAVSARNAKKARKAGVPEFDAVLNGADASDASANNLTVAESNDNLKLGKKDYTPPAELSSDLSVKDIAFDESADLIRHSSESSTDITITAKGYEAPDELKVDLSLPEEVKPNIKPKIKNDVVGQKIDVSLPSKEYEAPDELKVDLSMPENESFARPVAKNKSRGFGRGRKKPDIAISYLPPKEIILEDNDESYQNPNLNLEDMPNIESKLVQVENQNSKASPMVDEIPSNDDEGFMREDIKHDSEEVAVTVDYDLLAEEIKVERKKKVKADTVTEKVEEPELSEVQEEIYTRFPNKPNVNTRQLIKDVRSIDIVE